MISCIIGLHLLTYHADRNAEYDEVNPGIYTNCNGYTAGVYHNSEGRQSAYVGYTYSYKRVAVTTGMVYGYRNGPAPIIIPSVEVWNKFRLAYIPQAPTATSNTRAIHLMKEF